MLRFTFSPDGSLPKHAPAKYPDVLESNGSFTITVDDTFCLESPWAAFKCDSTFSFKEICKAVRELNDRMH